MMLFSIITFDSTMNIKQISSYTSCTIDFFNTKLKSSCTPTDNTDITNKQYIDNVITNAKMAWGEYVVA